MVNFTHDALTSVMNDFRVNCPYVSSNIPESLVYGAFVSQLIHYARVCSKYEDFLRIYSGFKVFEAGIFFTETSEPRVSAQKSGRKTFNKIKSRKPRTTFIKLYGRHTYIVHTFDTSVSHMSSTVTYDR